MPAPYMLRDAIERAIMTYDPIRTSETTIEIDVEGNDVVLNGYVRTDTMRSVATQLARGVHGVRTVRNLLYSDSDLEIMVGQAIEMRLGRLVVPVTPVVRSIRGHIFLRGPVPSEGARELIAESARMVPGVVMAHDLMEVDAVAIERMISPKRVTRAAKGGGAGSGQAMVGGQPVTAEDLPGWAMMAKEKWGMAEYKARAKAKMAWKRGEAADPKEMEEAGSLLRAGVGEAGEAAPESYETTEVLAEPLQEDALATNPAATLEEEEMPAAAIDLGALQAQFPAWALKPKEEWDKDDFKAQMQAKRAAKAGEGEAPEAVIERAQAALAAAKSGGTRKKAGGPKNAQEAAIAAVRQRFPGWSFLTRKEWQARDFTEAADARVLELRGSGQSTAEMQQEARAALEAALRGEAVAGGSAATRRDLTPEESAAVRAQLGADFPAWALKPKEEWDKDDFKGQMQAKRAAKSGAGDDPDAVIERAQAALQAALQAAWEALPLEAGSDEPAAAAPADPAGPRTIPAALLEKYPGWALKSKEAWDKDDFKAHAKAKSAFKKGEGPDPDALTAEAQAAF